MIDTQSRLGLCYRRRDFVRSRWPVAMLAVILAAVMTAPSRGETKLVAPEQAARVGLERFWFAQIPVDPSRSRASTWYLYHDRIYGVTDSGIVAALNAETGQQLWVRQVGKPGYPAFGPGANADYLGIVSGSMLYLLDRHDGRLITSRSLGSAPSSGPALSENHAFVALVTGRIEGYDLNEPSARPWYYQSKGRTYLRPTTTGRIVSWPTAAGYLYACLADEPSVLYRLETSGDIVTSPASSADDLFVASLDGYLYCLEQLSGRERWRFSTGYPITSSPAVVGEQVYVASNEPVLHALSTQTGKELWNAPGATHFAAQGKTRVYATDRFGSLLAIDAQTGAMVSRLQLPADSTVLLNDQSDRVFLVSKYGLVQGLREIGAEQPTFYQSTATPAEGAAPSRPPTPGAAPPTAQQPEESPFAEEEAAMDEPAAEAADEGSPFDIEGEGPADEINAEAPEEEINAEAPEEEMPAEAPDEDNPFEDF